MLVSLRALAIADLTRNGTHDHPPAVCRHLTRTAANSRGAQSPFTHAPRTSTPFEHGSVVISKVDSSGTKPWPARRSKDEGSGTGTVVGRDVPAR